MFTGIIESQGSILCTEARGGDLRLTISAEGLDWQSLEMGESISTNGVCLTVVEKQGSNFVADVSLETLAVTTIRDWQVGDKVNLERALKPDSRMGGHFVSGHVDGLGEVLSRESDGRSEKFWLRLPQALAKFVAHKGSITLDGVSLTVNDVQGRDFSINIVPHTLEVTGVGQYTAGTRVNLEVDVIARYLERLLLGDKAAEKPSMREYEG